MKPRIFTKILILALMIVLLLLYFNPLTRAQENAIFSVSPGTFTASDVPPLGTLYTVQNIVVWNHDNNARLVIITSEIPPEGETTGGYEPIPNDNWVIPYPSQITINANSYAIVQIGLIIPRWENLTSKKWEVWLPVERQPLPGDIGVLAHTVRMLIETTTTLPPGAKSTTYLTISSGENFTLQARESKYLTAELRSDGSLVQSGNPIEGENVTWSATAGTIAPSSGETNNIGQVTVVYTAPSYVTSVIVSASYAGSGRYEPSSVNSYGTITPVPSGGMSPLVYVGVAVVIVVLIAAILIPKAV